MARLRAVAPWLVLPVMIAAAFAAGLTDDGWRTPREVFLSVDPRSLFPRPYLGPEPLEAAAERWLLTAAFGLAIGSIVWTRRGPAKGGGVFAACSGLSLSLLIEALRLFKPGQLPDFRDPLITAFAATIAWWLLRFLPVQPVTPLPRHGPWQTRWRTLVRFLFAGSLAGAIAAVGLVLVTIQSMSLTPGQIAAGVARLPDGRTGMTGAAARLAAAVFDRSGLGLWFRNAAFLEHPDNLPYPDWVGARASLDGAPTLSRTHHVATIEMLRAEIDNAVPGDVILLQPGIYRISGGYIGTANAGTAVAPITVRAAHLGTAVLESNLPEAIKVAAPHWRFENLVLRGTCADDTACDNGIHVVGPAEDTILRNLRIEDFNAQIKINGEKGHFPDDGRIEHTTLINTHPRRTEASVTPIDLVAASGWKIEDNLIADFIKEGGNEVSYGAFAKGTGRGTIFTRNVVLCEWRLRGPKSETVGLSFGGGGTGQFLMRDLGRSGYEHADGLMADNLIAFCSDDGIYLNRAAATVLRHNTLIGTDGIVVRHPESVARIEDNIVDGRIQGRDGGLFWGEGNLSLRTTDLLFGGGAIRALFTDPVRLDLTWRHAPALSATAMGTDLCGAEMSGPSAPGAFLDYRACVAANRP